MPISGPPPIYAPPTDPAVAGQQAGPMAQFMAKQQGGGPGADQGGPPQPPPLMMVEQVMNQVALQLRDVARVLLMSKPMLMPILQKMIQAGSMLMDEIQKTNGQGQQGTDGTSEASQGGGGPDGGAVPTAQ